MIWPFKRKPNPASMRRLDWHPPDSSFREQSDYVRWAHRALSSPEGHALQAYLFSGIPQSIAYRGDQISTVQACEEYFRLVGYLECLTRLQESARMLPAEQPEIEADYDQTPPGQQTEQ